MKMQNSKVHLVMRYCTVRYSKNKSDREGTATVGPLSGFFAYLQNHVLNLVILFVGIVIIARSHKGDHKSALTTAGIALIGLLFVGLALNPTAVTGLAAGMVNWVTQ